MKNLMLKVSIIFLVVRLSEQLENKKLMLKQKITSSITQSFNNDQLASLVLSVNV